LAFEAFAPMRLAIKLAIVRFYAAPPAAHPSGVSLLVIFGIIGTIIGIAAAIQQFTSALTRRKFRRAEDSFFEAVQASRDIPSVKEEFNSLRSQIEVQIPRQAKEVYLAERLDQLERDLYNTYREYQRISNELPNRRVESDMDRRLREVVENSIAPARRIQERRIIYILILLFALIIVDLSPINLRGFINYYFDSLGYSDQWTTASLVSNFIAGVLVITIVMLISITLLPKRITKLAARMTTILLALFLALGSLGIGVFVRASAIRADSAQTYVDVTARETYAGVAFNIAAITLALSLACLMLISKRSIKRKLDSSSHLE
jgi:hypothetical protein